MSTTANPFSALSNHADSDDDYDQQDVKKNKGPRVRQLKGKKYEAERADKKKDTPTDHRPIQKKVPEPGTHPLDRHSGTGRQAYGNKDKKHGAGKGNSGRPIDDLKVKESGEIDDYKDKEGAEPTEEEQKEEGPKGITLDELYEQRRRQEGQKVNEKKAKITSDQLLKQAIDEKAEVLESRNRIQIDERIAGKKKITKVDDDHLVADTNAQYADLLNFKTGFVEKEYRERKRDDKDFKDFKGPRKGGKRDDEKKEGDAPKEGEQVQEQQQQPEGENQEKGERRNNNYKGERRNYDNRDNKGERRNYDNRDNKGGNRNYDNRDNRDNKGGYKAKKAVPQISNDDFPSLS